MKISFLTEHYCIRTMKQAMVLRGMGFDIFLVTTKKDIKDYPCFKYWVMYDSVDGLKSIVKDLSKTVDVWYIANEPNYTVGIVRQACPDAKIVVDIHDMNYWRTTPDKCGTNFNQDTYVSEDLMLNFGDGFVVPSMACKNHLDNRTSKPVAYVPSARPKQLFQTGDVRSVNGLVSMGGHSAPFQHELISWRDYTKIYEFLQDKINITALCPEWNSTMMKDVKKYYEKFKIQLEEFPEHLVLNRMSEFAWSLVGNWSDKPNEVWKYALPNKFWDSIAAGVPIVAINCPPVSELVDKYDIGITINHPKELLDRWPEHVQKRANLILNRENLCMENYINLLVDILENVYKSNKAD